MSLLENSRKKALALKCSSVGVERQLIFGSTVHIIKDGERYAVPG
jgi:hypothetical protein